MKPLDKVFGFENEKRILAEYIRSGEWFTISGIRRVGKTTLTRSIVSNLGFKNVYINLWELDEERAFEDFLFKLYRGLLSIKDKKFRDRLKSIEQVSFAGFVLRLKKTGEEYYLDSLIEDVIKKKLVVIIDEVQELDDQLKKLSKFLAALHDKYAPDLTFILLGSIASVKTLLEKKTKYTEPLLGRLIREFVLEPFNETEARKFLKIGFQECKIDINDTVIDAIISAIGTITGWLVEAGREIVIEKRASGEFKLNDILRRIEDKSREIVWGEIARALHGKKRPEIYLRILLLIASTPYISLAEISRALKRRKPTVLQYLEYLTHLNMVRSYKGRYELTDKLYRRAILNEKFIEEVKKRIIRL